MESVKADIAIIGVLTYNHKHQCFMLDNELLQNGSLIALGILGYWITGHLLQDAKGWYLLTAHGVGIRLRAGLTARYEKNSLPNVS